MADFNKSSANIAEVVARICHGTTTSYTYVDKKTNQEVTAHKFECFLLGEDAGVYMYGFLKGSQQQVKDAANKFKDGHVFKLWKIQLDTWTPTNSISSPKPFRLNLQSTKTQRIPAEDVQATQLPLAPVPPRTVAETAMVKSNKNQDLLAVVKAATNKRTTKDGTAIIDAELIDDSKAANGELATVVVSVWGAHKVSRIEDNVGKPLAFFNLMVKVPDGNNRQMSHYADAPLYQAPVCTKTNHLLAEAPALTAAQNTKQLSSEREWHSDEAVDVSGPVPLCCTSLLELTADEPAAANMPSVVQIPWLMIEEPQGEATVEVQGEGGNRIWFLAKTRDMSGNVRMGCPQKVALELASADDTQAFTQKHSSNSLGFPLFVHARVTRSVKQGSGQNAGKEFVAHTLRELETVKWTKKEAPNASINDLLAILNNMPANEESVQFCCLKDLVPDPHYGFSIEYDGKPGPRAAYAIVLVESVEKTKTVPFGSGFKAETKGIRDAAATGDASQLASYSAVGFGDLDTIVRLDPPRGIKRSRFAVLVVDKIEDNTIQMLKAEYVEPDDAQGAVTCFRSLRQVCKNIKQTTTSGSAKRTRAESTNFPTSPKDMKKCRTLKAMPTDTSIECD